MLSPQGAVTAPRTVWKTGDLEIRFGVPEEYRLQAAIVYFEIFPHEYPLLFGSRKRAIAVLRQDLNLAAALGALRGGRLVGIAGLCHQGRLVQLKKETFVREISWLTGSMRYFIFQRFTRPRRPGQLLMDGIGVDPAARGTGVGTALLRALFDFAHEHGYATIRLDVVNTNIDARRLYERLGFVSVRTHPMPPILRNILRYSSVTTMIRQVTPADSM